LCICCCCRSGPGSKAPVALQPLGLLYYPVPPLILDVSTVAARCLHVLRYARDPSSERWNFKSENISREFCLNTEFHVTFRDLLHAANLRHGTDAFTYPPKEGVLGIFPPLKIRRLRLGLNPQTWVLKANTHPLYHRSRVQFLVIVRNNKCIYCTGVKITKNSIYWN
jgi:hypothetical protein